MARSRTWPLLSAAGHVALLAALPMPAAHAARSQATLSSGTTVEADEIRGSPSGGVHAIGKVVVTGTQSTLSADRVDATPSKGPAGSSRSSVQEARASGHVRLTSQPKPDERMEATGTAGTYWPGTQKATLTGGVTVTMTSPQLQEPAVLTGARADIDLAQRAAEVSRTEAAQVALRLHPKADASSSGSAAAGPVRLDADRIRMENAANRITATGSPVLTGDQGTVRAEKIWFDVDPKANDIKMVHAAGSVRIDSQDAQGGTFHGKSDEAVMNRADDTVVLTGNVHGTHTRPDEPEPETLSTDVLTYNHKTGEWSMRSSSEARSRVTFKPKPKPAGAGGDGATGRSSRGRRGK